MSRDTWTFIGLRTALAGEGGEGAGEADAGKAPRDRNGRPRALIVKT
jgi:hypothetical protein